jgi:hypothetical protein
VKSKVQENENELLTCNVSVVEDNITFSDKFDLQAVSYVGGLLISKFKNDCGECQNAYLPKIRIFIIFLLFIRA